MTESADTPLIAFYSGRGTDQAGRSLQDVLNFSVDELESRHDYIQWLFPTYERSAANPSAPVLNSSDTARFLADQELRRNVRRALVMMLDFYGLQLESDGTTPTVVKGYRFDDRAPTWLTPRNHNHLRLTRILKFLCAIGASALAQALLKCLETISEQGDQVISPRTLAYWRDAVPR